MITSLHNDIIIHAQGARYGTRSTVGTRLTIVQVSVGESEQDYLNVVWPHMHTNVVLLYYIRIQHTNMVDLLGFRFESMEGGRLYDHLHFKMM